MRGITATLLGGFGRVALALAAIGIYGIMSALMLSRLMESQLFGISANDPVTYVVTALLLAAVVLAATWLPPRRAVRTDPSVALRAE